MNSGKVFSAPWSNLLRLITLFMVIVLLSMPVFGLINLEADIHPGIMFTLFVLPVAILIISAFFMIRSYEVRNSILHIQRLIWVTKLDLSDLESAETDPQAMKGSIRTFGNGGLFCFAGKFRNKKLGPYRAFATNPKLAVILRFPDKVVVVTPENPTEFARIFRPNRSRR